MQEKKKKIGIMGGTFDPIHISHLILAETAYEQFSLDKVLFLPAGNPPHKRNRKGGATDLERVEMVRRAIAGNSHFQLCLDEMNAEDYSYTYRTLEQMRAEHPDTEFYFIVGADSLFDFEQWREPERICRAASILVAVRDHVDDERLSQKMKELEEKLGGHFYRLYSTNLDISSKMIRDWIRRKKTVRYCVPEPVLEYISSRHIYGMDRYPEKDAGESGKETNRQMNGRYDLKKMEQKLAKHLDEDRMRHTLGVMYTAAGLAMVHGCSLEKAQVAGLLHDCAKCIPNKKKLKLCLENQIPMTEYEEKNPFILHAKLGAFLARKKYGVEDEEILEAITWHTTGKPDMSLLDKIIYLADYIEPGRDKASRLPYIRKLAFQDLDECMYQVLKDTLEYLSAGGADGIDEMTEEAYGYYREIHKKRNL